MAMGRPQTYSEEYVKKAEEYLLSCKDFDIERQTTRGNETVTRVKVPTKGGLAIYLGVNRDTLYDWSQKYEMFSDVMEKIAAEQEDRLINNGLAGTYNPTISKVLLTKHGYTEKIETDQTIKGDMKINIVNYGDNTTS